MPFIFRNHPLQNKKTIASAQTNKSNEVNDQTNEFHEVNDQKQNISLHEGSSDEQQCEDMILDEELFDFEEERKSIFIELFAAVMKTKIQHSVPNEALDELLLAMKDASQKSNLIFKKKFKEALKSQLRK